ncbi:hypothetical protein E2C01_000086 [Portunus trituberculatus]|uniref:Uncharacterized protein n=1 Tax=Portunus trituberculatus TaxID=210409 RepID=A0A5B7CFD8_PORTR|nr:hypothetical protein [Portunus trituberculatus]
MQVLTAESEERCKLSPASITWTGLGHRHPETPPGPKPQILYVLYIITHEPWLGDWRVAAGDGGKP